MLLAGLRLGLRETTDFLMMGTPSFEDFEAWVLMKNNGAIEPARMERLNGALRGYSDFVLESILPEPVLSRGDLDFWDKNGYVVVKLAVSRECCRTRLRPFWVMPACRWSSPIPGTKGVFGFPWRTTQRSGPTGIRRGFIPPLPNSGAAAISG